MLRASLSALFLAPLAAAQSATEDATLFDPDPTDSGFGTSLSLDGDRALVGAYLDQGAGFLSGAAYVVERDGDTWTLGQKLVPSDTEGEALFGVRVAIDGDRALVAANREQDFGGDGAVYVFERQEDGEWLETAVLFAADGTLSADFGWGLALEGDRAAVSAYRDGQAGSSAGRAYVFERQPDGTWLETADFVGSETGPFEYFGRSLALSGDRLVLGAPESSSNLPGKAYVFELRNGVWLEDDVLRASDAGNNDQFGWAVGIDGSRVVVGACYDDDGGNKTGSAYVFELQGNDWVETQKLLSPAPQAAAEFGFAVSIVGPRILVGEERATVDGVWSAGAGHLFARQSDGTWELEMSLKPENPQPVMRFGSAFSMDDETIFVGNTYNGEDDLTREVWAFDVGTLFHGEAELSLTDGGSQDLLLRAGEHNAGHSYWMLGSVTGSAPGIPLGGVTLPLNYDPYFQLTLSAQGMVVAPGGVLDAKGHANLQAVLPSGLDPALNGLEIHHAYLLFDGLTFQLFEASNAVSLELVP